jgi:membrane protein implicated in regulation of membrane protease activity
VLWVRPLFLQPKKKIQADATEAKTLIEIKPGEVGRVLYEGSSWQARCEDKSIALAANQRVYVLRREGNMLIIVPEDFFDAPQPN